MELHFTAVVYFVVSSYTDALVLKCYVPTCSKILHSDVRSENGSALEVS